MAFKAETMVYEDGTPVGRYTPIPNDVLDKLADMDLSKDERKILYRIIRNTIGYEEKKNFKGKSVRRASFDFDEDYLEDRTGVSKNNIEPILASFETRGIIKRERSLVTFNHHLDEWE